jgi:hypothetical protein
VRWLRRGRRSHRAFSRADLLAVSGFAVALVVVAGASFLFGGGSRRTGDQLQTSPTSSPTTAAATTTTLFAQSPTSSSTTTSSTTTTTTIARSVPQPRQSYAPVVNVVSFDPQCGPYITITARIDAAAPIQSVSVTVGPRTDGMANISQGVWQATVTVPAASDFVIIATDANGSQGSTSGTLYNC